MHLKLVEPLRELFKDEVRELGLRARAARAHRLAPAVPGPGLAVRILGEVTAANLDLLRARRRDHPGGDRAGRPDPQDLAVLRRAAAGAVGRRDGRRAHLREGVVLRAVHSLDGMTADWAQLPDRAAAPHLEPDHQRGQGRQPRGLRHLVEAPRDDRVGVGTAAERARSAGAPLRSALRRGDGAVVPSVVRLRRLARHGARGSRTRNSPSGSNNEPASLRDRPGRRAGLHGGSAHLPSVTPQPPRLPVTVVCDGSDLGARPVY